MDTDNSQINSQIESDLPLVTYRTIRNKVEGRKNLHPCPRCDLILANGIKLTKHAKESHSINLKLLKRGKKPNISNPS